MQEYAREKCQQTESQKKEAHRLSTMRGAWC
jgi:hypothetical protein